MFGQSNAMPGDKMLKLFIIQAISSFVAGDHESGLHYLNEIKMSYAEYHASLNPTLKSLAKEIIQSLDMFAPGASADMFAETNKDMENVAHTPQQEMQAAFAQPTQSAQPVQNTQPAQNIPAKNPSSVTSDLQDLLNRRRARKKNR